MKYYNNDDDNTKSSKHGRNHNTLARPATLRREASRNTRYMNMLLALDGIPRLHNMLAGFFTWILLAGFVLLPGTFTSLQNSSASQTGDGARVLEAIQHLPLFVIAFTCAGIGALGMLWLWWRWNQNYLWLNHRIFSPGMLNSFAGIVSTLVNVYGVQHGEFSKTAKVTIIVTCASAIVCGSLTLFYTLFLLKRVRRAHNREVGRERAVRHGEGFLEEIKRKANELEPGVA
ncbi:hypothetical protein HMN09_00541900 [Mycena chlorophos]|uniref:Uncharacterized protein n=1 Tax=Mycena chlorophos TaxID=658473 RepID=A0A8H6WCP5_MYCCL|nr:hypothetical protein HMN09_00541900 [Mycena chlorophos]